MSSVQCTAAPHVGSLSRVAFWLDAYGHLKAAAAWSEVASPSIEAWGGGGAAGGRRAAVSSENRWEDGEVESESK